MTRSILITLVVVLGFGCASRDRVPSIAYERYQLENGLTVILHEDHGLPLVSVNIWYYVGAKDEPVGRSGFAHLFEHLMFGGTRRVPTGEFDRIMEHHGASNNATTSQDRTNYFESGPSNMLEIFLFLEADRMTSLGQDITQAKLDTEREVVRNERRQRFEDVPYMKAYLSLWPESFPAGHPYDHSTIGSHEDLEAATVNDVQEFFARFYVPGNASLVVAGDIDRNQTREWIEKYFGAVPASPDPEHASADPASFSQTKRLTLRDRVQLPRTMRVYHSPAFYADGDADMDIVATVLGGGKTSRLYRRLIIEKQLAQSVNASQMSSLLGSLFVIQATARPGVKIETLEAEIDKVIEELKTTSPPTDRECLRAKNSFETSFWTSVESVSTRADLLNRYQFYFDDPGALGKDLARYAEVSPRSAGKWLDRVLLPEARLTLRILPEVEEVE